MTGELLTRVTVWISLFGYAAGLFLFLFSKSSQRRDTTARTFWTIACLALLIHIAYAFHYYHGWSHTSAYIETARQTLQVYGIYWGGGVYVNYALMIAWIVDVIWWWRGVEVYRRRFRVVSIVWHSFLFFIFFNATVVFEGGLLRWLALFFTGIVFFLLVLKTAKTQNALI